MEDEEGARYADVNDDAEHLTERTRRMVDSLRESFEDSETLDYHTMVQGKSRRTAAVCLFELTVLASMNFVQVQQKSPFGPIAVNATELLGSV